MPATSNTVELKALMGFSETGPARTRNEDTICADPKAGLGAVADGVSSLPHGQLASQTAISHLIHLIRNRRNTPPETLLHRLNQLCRPIGRAHSPRGFGTTLTFGRWSFAESRLYFGHIGDCSAFHLQDGKWKLLTRADTVANEEIQSGITPSQEALHTLTQCLAQTEVIDPQSGTVVPAPGDKVVILSDGITGVLDLECFAQESDPFNPLASEWLASLRTAVLKKNPSDNFSAVVFQF